MVLHVASGARISTGITTRARVPIPSPLPTAMPEQQKAQERRSVAALETIAFVFATLVAIAHFA